MKSLWNDREARKAKDRLDLLVYSSRLIGSEPKLCVWGGGNTSTKTIEKDHRGIERRVLRIKGSGSDLKTSERKDYPPVDLDQLTDAFKIRQMTDEEMVDYVSKCLLEPKAPRPSIEVLLHAFVDQPDIHHTHADAILSVTNTKRGRQIAGKIYGSELLWVPYVKPGFTLAKWVGEAYLKNPEAKGVILEKHGLITWGPDARTSYKLTIEMVTRAERYLSAARRRRKFWNPQIHRSLSAAKKREWLLNALPIIRKTLSARERVVLTFHDSPAVMEFVNARETPQVSQIGPATPDHMLRTKRTPLYVRVPEKNPFRLTKIALQRQIENYAAQHERYFSRHKGLLANRNVIARQHSNGPKQSQRLLRRNLASSRNDGKIKMLDPYPKVILIPGVGMVTSGKDLKSANIVAEIYEHSISVMTHASCIDQYDSLSERLAFEMDYWPMELYKLSLAPPEAEFSRQTGLVTGAARGIGKAIARKLAKNGAHVFLADLKVKEVQAWADEINRELKSKRAFALEMDVTNPVSVKHGFERMVLECGGIDFLISNAGIAHVSSIEKLELKDWEKSLAVNATGHFLVAREAVQWMKRQKTPGSIVFIASKNVLAPGKDFGAYSAAKAAETQLARILAIENGECGIRVNLVNPDGVFEDSGLWDRIRKNRAKTYKIAPQKLEDYYRKRNLMKIRVLPEDVAESVRFLVSNQSSKTTGCILTVDGGVKEAFPR